ncbi:DUF4145 domain-containing protein [Patescibacteria group bacterium]|nr:DUF4145 domain-containing protein [Patescibacteria group bacterium]
MIPFTPPQFQKSSFNCPYCQAFSVQEWATAYANSTRIGAWSASLCRHCHSYALWLEKQMIFPDFQGIEPPNTDLDTAIKEDYMEASSILDRSPRGAAALLRLAVQKLCKQLGCLGKNINDDIAKLVKDGLPLRIQKALDTVRVTGNEAVHPGTLDLKDNKETAQSLFRLINFIAEKMLSEPKEIDDLFESLPETKKAEIKKRDEK